jgi:hypothetical protein
MRDFNDAYYGLGEADRADAVCTVMTFIRDRMGLGVEDALVPTMLMLRSIESISEAAPGGLAAFVDNYLYGNNNNKAEYLLGKYGWL